MGAAETPHISSSLDLPAMVEALKDMAKGRDSVTFGEVADVLGRRGHGPLLFVLSTFLILPIGWIPGVGGALGILMAVVGVEMLRGRRGIWLPGVLRNRTLPAARIGDVATRMRGPVDRIARILKPRFTRLVRNPLSILAIAGLLIVGGLSMLVIGAIPILSPLVGLPVLCFALGVTAADGRFILAGYTLVLPPILAVILI